MLLSPDILQIRSPAVCFHVLRAGDGLHLIDAGFIGGISRLHEALRRADWNREPIRGILLTHGHIDHILNAAAIAHHSGAWIAAPSADATHYAGNPEYTGISRVCGAMESLCKSLCNFRPLKIDRWLEDQTEIPIWDGLTTIHLPGHTAGHTGFYSANRRLLFSADLVASHGSATLPPAIFNTNARQIPESIARACRLDLIGTIPNHADRATPAEHLARLRRLNAKLSPVPQTAVSP